MVDANTSSTQQASDAQHVDNMTSMQQSTPDAPSGARSDAPVQTTNVGSQDGPSQLNANPNGNSANNNNLGSIARNSPIDGGSSGTVGNLATRGGDGGGGINGLAGNGGGEGQQGQGGTGDGGARGGNAVGNNSGGGGSSNAGVVAAAGAGARGAGGFGAPGTGSGSGNANGPTSGGGEGGGANPPPANATPPASGAPAAPILLGADPAPTFTAVDPNRASNSSGQPSFSAAIFYEQYTTGHLTLIHPFAQNLDVYWGLDFDPYSLAVSEGAFLTSAVDTTIENAWNHSLSYRLFYYGEQQDLCVAQTNELSSQGYGTFSIDRLGNWIYTVVNSPLDSTTFVNGAQYTDTFTVHYEGKPDVVISIHLLGTENGTAVIVGDPLSSNSGDYFIDPRHLVQDANDHSNLVAQGSLGAAATGFSEGGSGNIGNLVLEVNGHYTYLINQVGVNSLGQLDTTSAVQDTIVLGQMTTIFSEGHSHTDTFNVALADGSSEILNFHLSDALGGSGSIAYNPATPTVAIAPITFSFGGGIQSVSVLEGNDTQNVHFAQNIGHLNISNVGGIYSYSYTVTNVDITNWQNSHPGVSFTGPTVLPHVDTFIISSISDTAGVRDVNIQELSFNIFQDSHAITVAADTPYSASAGSEFYRYTSWASIHSAVGGDEVNHINLINNFNVDQDRIDLSGLLTNSADILTSTVHIDNTAQDSIFDFTITEPITNLLSHTDLSVYDGSNTWVVANLNGVEASIPEIMWNNEGIAGPVSALNAAHTWTDIVDITSAAGNVGPAAIFAADGHIITGALSDDSTAWTILIKSGTATVDGSSIHFADPHSGEVIITTADGNLHDIKNVDAINWHAAA